MGCNWSKRNGYDTDADVGDNNGKARKQKGRKVRKDKGKKMKVPNAAVSEKTSHVTSAVQFFQHFHIKGPLIRPGFAPINPARKPLSSPAHEPSQLEVNR